MTGTISITEAGARLGISRAAAYRNVADGGELSKCVVELNRKRISVAKLQALLGLAA